MIKILEEAIKVKGGFEEERAKRYDLEAVRYLEDCIIISFPYKSNSFDKSKVSAIAEEVKKMEGKITREIFQYDRGERLKIKIPVSSRTIEHLPSGRKEKIITYTPITAITILGEYNGKLVEGASLYVEPHYIDNENVRRIVNMISTLYEWKPKNL
ncbi:MAG: hypothetical protein QMD14_04265 [Candidatus Aenigmarchaeota archaeon]|nr:hypothetical protein [Candidatus Aenigmarchaeota archaeon]